MRLFLNGKMIEKIADKIHDKSDRELYPAAGEQDTAARRILFAPHSEAKSALEYMGLSSESILPAHQATHFESRYTADYIYLDVPCLTDIPGEHHKEIMLLAPSGLLVLYDELPAVKQVVEALEAWQGEFPKPDRVFTLLLTRLTAGDNETLSDIEEEIAGLEEQIISKVKDNYNEKISELRKRLMVLHRYYEGLFEALEDMEENQNGLLDKAQLKNVRLQKDRCDRFSRAVGNLRDYVTQVREAYQNQLDISLNETMKLFTVITAIFLPLTLIAGWYGMNLSMPEYELDAAYPIVIVVSLAVVIGCIWYFKKHKWF